MSTVDGVRLPLASPNAAVAAGREAGSDGALTRILVVDDNVGARYAMRRTLEGAGFVVAEASTGQEAFASVETRPDLVIVDVHLPDTNGQALSSELRAMIPGPLPVLQISATSIDPSAQVAGLEGGADAYLPGPFDPSILVATVRALLRAARAERAAASRSAQWQATFDSITDGVLLLDSNGRIAQVNRAAETILATTARDCLGRQLREILDLPDLEDPELLSRPERVGLEATTGSRWLRLTFDPVTAAGGDREGTVVVASDVTERKELDFVLARALRQQQHAADELARASAAEQAYRKLLEAVVNEMPVGVIVADAPSGRIVIDNAEMNRIMHGPTAAGDGSRDRRTYAGFHEDGRPYRPEEWPLTRSAAAGETVRDEELDVRRDDGSGATISVSSMPIRAEDGTIVAAVATVSDITRRREAEHLRDAFIGVLSHELRTPITSIFGGSKVLLRDAEDLDEVRRGILQDLADESERLNRMVENLLVLARVERGVPLSGQEPILLQRVLPRIVAEEARQWPGLDLRLVVADDVPTVAGDESYVDQVIRNLISNAGKYGPAGGTVTIEVRTPDEREAHVAVLDEGEGIDEAEAGRLFDLFFRSSAVSNKTAGSGIGLFVSRHLVEGMGGRMWAKSRPEGGSEFGFSLPAYEVT